jgi:hypothetical protein
MQNSTGLITSARPDVFKLRNTCYQQLERGEKAKLPVREIVQPSAIPSYPCNILRWSG